MVAAVSFPALRDTVLPIMEELVTQTGTVNWTKNYAKSNKELTLPNGGKILFRSMDDPNSVLRGPEYTYAFLDEGRNMTFYHWKLVAGRLRQKGYKLGAWVASTPNGHDWMYQVFHPESEQQWEDAEWYGAPTYDNARNLPESYIPALEAGYEGRFFEQEVLGHFVGVIEGGVFPKWDPRKHIVEDLDYNSELPLYTFWDFGIGDPGVCVFAQVAWLPAVDEFGLEASRVKVPWLYILDYIEAKDWTAKDWAEAWQAKLNEEFKGARPAGNFGDPAGIQRNPSTGTSIISDLNTAGVPLEAVPKRPQDYAIRILNNLMEGDRVLVAKRAERVGHAFGSHKWKTNTDDVRIGLNPVHDWTSHFVDAVRYGATVLLGFHPRRDVADETERYGEDTYGHVFQQLMARPEPQRAGQRSKKHPTFSPPPIRPRS